MDFSNLQLMKDGRAKLAPFAGLSVLVTFVYLLLLSFASLFEDENWGIISLLISGPLSFGMVIFSRAVFLEESPHLNQLFEGFKSFLKSFLAYFAISILIIIGLLFLIVPGIIVSLGFSMTFFVMDDHPELSFVECMKESWNLMRGYKLKFLGLWLRFIPWLFLGLLCFGVGLLLVVPWSYVSTAAFYEKLKEK